MFHQFLAPGCLRKQTNKQQQQNKSSNLTSVEGSGNLCPSNAFGSQLKERSSFSGRYKIRIWSSSKKVEPTPQTFLVLVPTVQGGA